MWPFSNWKLLLRLTFLVSIATLSVLHSKSSPAGSLGWLLWRISPNHVTKLAMNISSGRVINWTKIRFSYVPESTTAGFEGIYARAMQSRSIRRVLLLDSREHAVLAATTANSRDQSEFKDLVVKPAARDRKDCENTVQGRDLIADDRGMVCARRDVHIPTGCCPTVGEPFSCHQCNRTTKCCSVYEQCVSCCLNPAVTVPETAMKVPRAPNQPFVGTYTSVFDFCRGRCRHNSKSVVHENAYRSNFHHCYRMPVLESAESAFIGNRNSLEGVIVVVGQQGQSCQAACAASDLQCELTKLQALNDCSMLQKHFSCKGSCVGSMGPDQPAEVVPTAPRHQNPGACLYSTRESFFDCDGFHANTRRLCPCTAAI